MSIHAEEPDNIDLAGVSSGEAIPLSTPGDILGHEFLEPFGISANALAAALSVAVTPLAIPILGGPGTITTAMN